MLRRLFSKDLKTELYKTKKIVVCGVRFEIKKINLLDYLNGSKVLLQQFDTYKTAGVKNTPANLSEDNAKKHLADVLVAGVVNPKLTHKENGNDIPVNDLFMNMDMSNELYMKILEYTYGKKKVRQLISADQKS